MWVFFYFFLSLIPNHTISCLFHFFELLIPHLFLRISSCVSYGLFSFPPLFSPLIVISCPYFCLPRLLSRSIYLDGRQAMSVSSTLKTDMDCSASMLSSSLTLNSLVSETVKACFLFLNWLLLLIFLHLQRHNSYKNGVPTQHNAIQIHSIQLIQKM